MIWHPFTSQASSDLPLRIVRAEREFIYDESGKAYIDAIASWWTVIHGHNHPSIRQAIHDQLEKLDHVMLAGFTHAPAEQLAANLLSRSEGNFSRVFYSDNGSTAVEVMLKLARQYWVNRGEKQRRRFIRFDAAYHGDTFGAMSVAGPSLFTEPF
ncbi:MAG TPA: aminotransferase class III-fold pyridoxal phosphate-dependent enzyme, partial [Turneriella sp.]|nr:aminotransferase class III-fold pyridoxal phosphate-dependent enzyme [Turneriella sp.]